MTSSYQHVYLSPHYDDAALSCGGAIHQQIQAGQSVLVITICAASPPPDEPLSPFAQRLHQSWGNFENIVATRRAEDQISMEILGVDYLWLHFTDCIYRGDSEKEEWYYTSINALFSQIHPADLSLTAEISKAIVEKVSGEDNAITYAPLTVGNHIDHQLVHAVAWQLRQQGWITTFYEDYPYTHPGYPFGKSEDNPHTLQATLAAKQIANLQPQLRLLSEENLQAKIESVRAYVSQVPMLFGSDLEMEKLVRDYALYIGGGKLAERTWTPA